MPSRRLRRRSPKGASEEGKAQRKAEFLLEGSDVLPKSMRDMTAELLRRKGLSDDDSLSALLSDTSIIYIGIPRIGAFEERA